MMVQENKSYRHLKGNLVFGAMWLIVLYMLISSTLLSQMNAPLFLFPQTEWFYVVVFKSGILQFITSRYWSAVLFDLLLLGSPLLFLLTRNRIFAILFTVLLLLYYFTFNMVTGHHYHGLVGAMVITIPFWVKSEKSFLLLWQGCRYYLLYIFASAALWKIMRGSAFHAEQLPAILKMQQLQLQLELPNSFRAAVSQYLITHVNLTHTVLLLNTILQLSFVVGFVTKKHDNWLLFAFVLFVASNYLVMGIMSTELLVLGFTLINWYWMSKKLGYSPTN